MTGGGEARRCYFCGEKFRYERGTPIEEDMFAEEVGEFWSEKLQDSFLGHPDCLPMGITATIEGQDPDWKMA